jgi:ABC-type branched-subunit amino acid transport system substrate-binding protein
MLIELIAGLAAPAAAPAVQNAQALYDRGVTWRAFYDAADVLAVVEAASGR